MLPKYPFDEAVEDYFSSLTNERKLALLKCPLIERHEQDWSWFRDVIDRYDLRNKSNALVRDINERVAPDFFGVNNIVFGGVGVVEPLHEARTLLNAVIQKIAKSSR